MKLNITLPIGDEEKRLLFEMKTYISKVLEAAMEVDAELLSKDAEIGVSIEGRVVLLKQFFGEQVDNIIGELNE